MNSQRTPRTSRRQPPVMPQGEVIADFKQYPDALAYVDNLIKNNFPAGSVAIVGSDLRTVERVRGKINYARLALSGATTGAWIGLIFGFLFTGNVDPSNPATFGGINSMASSIVIGAGLGMLLSVIRYSLNKNKRTFISQSSVVASKYQVQVPAHLAEQARAIPAVAK